MIYITKVIKTIRDSHPDMVKIFTQGSCYHFYLILKEIFPSAQPYYDMNHVITKIGSKFYDITGEVRKGRHILLDDQDIINQLL